MYYLDEDKHFKFFAVCMVPMEGFTSATTILDIVSVGNSTLALVLIRTSTVICKDFSCT